MSTPIIAVHYRYDPHRVEDRDRIRPEHRAFLQELGDDLLAAGPYVDDPHSALLLIRGSDRHEVLSRLEEDPFRRERILVESHAHEWSCALGSAAPMLKGETA